ncbi:ATP-sensitive inward rectifier potassium channel 11-like [Sitophilus oryzae]|uniref:ATP-sensitive inward rectifier potassium channel 11-like n=1 Tax=Sitophilus oryzae TaxID=7048 RepID=A0A6J2XLZ0_SITOR|nr:ATP-sensitive inward rectifier potassium channel 11-like [Sitophilus oryzae]
MFDTENNYTMTKRPGRVPKRIVFKNGYKNVFKTNAKHYHRWKYLQGMFASLLDAQWRWTIQFLVLEFFGSWLFFALIWWLIALVHGDLQKDHLPPYQSESGWTPCVLEVYGFSSCFLFSMETQHTTGYGLRMITEECPEAIFILCVQCIVGLIIDSFTIGLVFAKMIRSKLATHTIQFSRNAVISRRDGKLCFMFRVGDIRRSRLVEVSVRAILVKNERTREGELLNNYQTELCLKTDETRGNILFLWPLTVYHIIDENSPLSDFSVPEILKTHKIEIIVLLTGTVESTGAFTEASSSYLAHEILWDHKFESIVSFNGSIDCYELDWSKFDNLIPVNQLEESTDDGISKNKSDYPAHLKQKLIFLPSTRNTSEIFLRNEIRIQKNQSITFNKYKNKYFNTFANRKPLHDRFLLKDVPNR